MRDRKVDSLSSAIPAMAADQDKVRSMLMLSQLWMGVNDSISKHHATEAIVLVKTLGDAAGIALAYDQMAKAEKRNNQPERAIGNFDSALVYFQKAKRLRSQGLVLNELGIMWVSLGEFETARQNFIDSKERFIAINDSAKLAEAYSNIGLTYDMQGIHSIALESYFRSLAIDEKLANKWGVASDYMSIGITLKKQKEYEDAEVYYTKALDIYTELDDEYAVAQVLTNMGVLYKDRQQLTEAEELLNKARAIFTAREDKKAISVCLHNLATISVEKKEYAKALKLLSQSDSLNALFANKLVDINNKLLYVQIFMHQSQADEAIEMALEAMSEADELALLEEKHQITDWLAQAYALQADYGKAYSTMEMGKILRDSLFNLGRSRQMQELHAQYEASNKEKEIALLNQEKIFQQSELKRKSQLQRVTFAATGFLAVIAFLLFRVSISRQQFKRALLDKQLQEEKKEAERLQELDEAKSRFFANIAHEFRTPLTLILGPTEQILHFTADRRTKRYTQLIRDNANKLLLLINQLLDLVKLESGMIHLQPARADFIAFLKGQVLAFETLAEEKDIHLAVHTEQDEIRIEFDREKMGLVVSNLMSNAIKFTEPFGEISVTVATDERLKRIRFEVEDTGIGVSAEQLPFIFDRFYQTDDSRTRKAPGTGTGIGLALVKELIELHNGSIEVISQLGSGTRFSVLLPINQKKQLSDVTDTLHEKQLETKPLNFSIDYQHQLTETDPAIAAMSAGETILVVEDNAAVLAFIRSVLEESYRVIEAMNGEEGLQKAIELVPDLIISDVMMPIMDGHAMCQKMKDDIRTSHIPIIMLTAKSDLESKIDGLNAGADDYLAKPFNGRELMARINNLIRMRKRLQEKFGEEALVPQEKENAFLAQLKGIIDLNLDKGEFNVADIGRALAMSRTQVHRKLKALTSLSTSQFVRQHKLSKAVELLKSAEHNVSEVAYMLGFSTPNYFSTCFTEQFGYPPSEAKSKKH
jgi:signal transduction histidine kinase/DNA-binding response OmpR family regulator